MIEYVPLVSALESPSLNPGIGKMSEAILTEQQHAANRGHLVSLMVGHNAKRIKVAAPELSDVGKQL